MKKINKKRVYDNRSKRIFFYDKNNKNEKTKKFRHISATADQGHLPQNIK